MKHKTTLRRISGPFILFAFCLANSLPLHSQGLEWAQQLRGNSGEYTDHLLTNDDGSLMHIGLFRDSLDVDSGPDNEWLINPGADGVFIRKTDPDGNLVWAKSLGGVGGMYPTAAGLDPAGNILIAGRYKDTVDVDPGPGQHLLTRNELSNNATFILKLTPDGGFIWVIDYSGGINLTVNDITADPAGNLYAAGDFSGAGYFDPPNNSVFLSANPPTGGAPGDAFELKLNPNGQLQWARDWGGDWRDGAHYVRVGKDGLILTSGVFRNKVDFDPGPNKFELTGDATDLFIHAMHPDGTFAWVKQILVSDISSVLAMETDQNGNLLLAGFFNSPSDFDPGPDTLALTNNANDAFLAKYDLNGNVLWAQNLTGNKVQKILDVDVDELGDVYVTGDFEEEIDLDPGSGVFMMTTPVNTNAAFMAKYDFLGRFVWGRQFSGRSYGVEIAVAKNGPVYAAGNFYGTCNLNPGSTPVNFTSWGDRDVYLLKLNQEWRYNGSVFNDINSNGIFDNGEYYLKGIPVSTSSGFVSVTGPSGNFYFYDDLAGDTIRAALPWPGWAYEPPFYVPTAPTQGMIFAARGPQVAEVAVHAVAIQGFRPGFESRVEIQVANLGTLPLINVPVSLKISQNTVPVGLTIVSSDLNPAVQTGDSIVWILPNLDFEATKKITVVFRTDPGVPLQSSIQIRVWATVAADAYPPNNTSHILETVKGSFDPNDKRVSPEAVSLADLNTTDLQYVIRFQNTGNHSADFVVVRDTLPTELDLSTLRVTGFSHPNSWRIYGQNILEFRFDPILLPDSLSDEPGSHGYVSFSIQAKHGLPLNTLILNRAAIYFDYNDPVITNMSVMHVGTSVGTQELQAANRMNFLLAPNPAGAYRTFRLEWTEKPEEPANVFLFDSVGRLLHRYETAARERDLILPGLAPGLYFVEARQGERSVRQVLIVQ